MFYPFPIHGYTVCVSTEKCPQIAIGQFFYLKMGQDTIGNEAIQNKQNSWTVGNEFPMAGVKYISLTPRMDLSEVMTHSDLRGLNIKEILSRYGIHGIGLELSIMRKLTLLLDKQKS